MKIAIILGSSNSDGNTRHLVNKFIGQTGATLFDLADYNISFYDYQHENKNDDFVPIAKELIGFDHIVFASPMYWYSMSAQLKMFFDRISDLLTIEKEIGRALKGKSMSVLSTGFDKDLPDCFIQPFRLTAAYLNMEYKGCGFASIQSDDDFKNVDAVVAQAIDNIKESREVAV